MMKLSLYSRLKHFLISLDFWNLILLTIPILGVFSSIIPTGLIAQAEKAYEVLETAEERYQALNNLCARFHQEIDVTLLKEKRYGEGIICQRQPSEFSMRFSKPDGDMVIVDGNFLWVFYPSIDRKQVMRFAASNSEDRFNFYKNLLRDPRERFDAEYQGIEEMDARSSHKISVTPNVRAEFHSAVVWIDTDRFLITGIDVHDANESIRRIRLTDIQVDVEMPEDEFSFIPPSGTVVITR
jgi:outer membrane lipoprotein carrier protein